MKCRTLYSAGFPPKIKGEMGKCNINVDEGDILRSFYVMGCFIDII